MTLRKKLEKLVDENPNQLFRVQMSSGGAERSKITEFGDDYIEIVDRNGITMNVNLAGIVHIYPVPSMGDSR